MARSGVRVAVAGELQTRGFHVTPLHVNFTPSPEQKMCEYVPANVCTVDLSEVPFKKRKEKKKPLCCRFRLSAPPEALSSVCSIGS